MSNKRYVHFYSTWQVYAQLPMKAKTVLPDEGFPYRPIKLNTIDGQTFEVRCDPKPVIEPKETYRGLVKPHNAKHRLFAKCLCGKEIPFGRMGQHRKACTALQDATRI